MNQLKIDHESLFKLWIKKPSSIWAELESQYPTKVQKVITRYKHLLLNKIFTKKNWIWITNFSKPLTKWAKNWKKHIINKTKISWIIEEIISYPIHQIYVYIIENIDELKENNLSQIKVAKKFNIVNLWILRKIIKSLWLEDELKWKYINMPVDKFESLIDEVNKLEKEKDYVESIDFLNIWSKIGINNPQNLHTWLSAINITNKYSLPKIRLSSIDNTLQILDYIEKKYPKNKIFSNEDINEISQATIQFLPISTRDNKEKIIKSILAFFNYKYIKK